MKQVFFISIILHISVFTLTQAKNEELVQTDTVRIAPGFIKMLFKYYLNPGEYGRFEIYNLDSKLMIQNDTLESFSMASYEDANFDGILDLKIVLELGANSGNDRTDYYIFNPKTKIFELKIVDLSQPTINIADSTITESSGCCMGTEGSSKTYRYINGVLTVTAESEYNRESSYRKILVNGSMVTINYSSSTIVNVINGQQTIVDSSMEYSFGKLRVIQVQKKRTMDPETEEKMKDAEVVESDVMGTFIFDSSEYYKYTKTGSGKINRYYLHEINKKNKWVTIKESNTIIEE